MFFAKSLSLCTSNPFEMHQIDKLFISQLKKKIPQNKSATEEIASILGINYDAAYRRLKGKVEFSLCETILLSKRFDISLNELFEVGEQNTYLIKGSTPVKTLKGFNEYLKRLNEDLTPFANRKDSSILISAQELPMFYYFDNPLLIRFKVFIWTAILGVSKTSERIKFCDFLISDEIYETASKLRKTYDSTNATEVWSFNAINTILQQLLYLYKMRQVNTKEAIEICGALIEMLKKIEFKTINGGKSKNRKYALYSNDMVMMSNSVILKYKDKMIFSYPYALLKFFKIESQKACKEQESYIMDQILHASCITSASTQEHASFFNLKYDKINQVIAVIKNEETKPVFL